MNSSPCLPSLKEVPEASLGGVTPAIGALQLCNGVERATTSTRELWAATSAAQARPPVLSGPAPSSSNGETLLLHSSRAADTSTVDVGEDTECAADTLYVAERAGITASIELSPSPSIRSSLNASPYDDVAGDEVEEVTASRALSEVQPDSGGDVVEELDSEEEAASLRGVQRTWTRQVRVGPHPSSAHSNAVGGAGVLSDAAANVIAQALYRASLLRRCIEKWEALRERLQQWRHHQDCFAVNYYEHNLRYLMFRAWQWRYDNRRRWADVSLKAAALRQRQLCRLALHRWRAWRQRQQSNRQHVQTLLLEGRAVLRERYFTTWRRCSALRAQSTALESASHQRTRRLFFERWCTTVFARKRSGIVVRVISLHMPTAWSATEDSQRELLRRYSWIQWLRVTMLRRAVRLQHRAVCTEALTTSTTQAYLRRRYVTWLQVTAAKLQSQHVGNALALRYFLTWCRIGTLSAKAQQLVDEVRHPRSVRRCWVRWHERCRSRERHRKRIVLADTFMNSVMDAHLVNATFQQWRERWMYRQRARRMRRVAEDYARPALLRHLFLLRVRDGVLGSMVDLGTADTCTDAPADNEGGRETTLQSVQKTIADENTTVSINGQVQPERTTLLCRTPMSAQILPSMKPPIPLHQPYEKQLGSHKAADTTSAVKEEEGQMKGQTPLRDAATAAAQLPALISQQLPSPPLLPSSSPSSTSAMPLPPSFPSPPPSYDEVVKGMPTAAHAGSSADASSAPHATRGDIGVGTEPEHIANTTSVASDSAHCSCGRDARGCSSCGASAPPQLPAAETFSLPAAYSTLPWPFSYYLPYPTPQSWLPPSSSLSVSPPPLRRLHHDTFGIHLCDPSTHPIQGVRRCSSISGDGSVVPAAPRMPCVPYLAYANAAENAHADPNVCQCLDRRNLCRTATNSEFFFRAEMQRQDEVPTSVSPRVHNSLAVHRHADPSVPAALFTSARPTRGRGGVCDVAASETEIRAGGGQEDTRLSSSAEAAQVQRVMSAKHDMQSSVTPILSSMPLPTEHCRVPLTMAASEGNVPVPSSANYGSTIDTVAKETPAEDQQTPRSASHSTSSSTTLCDSAAVNVLAGAVFPQTVDSAALRITARSLLEDYKYRTRLLPSEKAELKTIDSRLALVRQLGLATEQNEQELQRRRGYLQMRVLEWQQKRAQVAQLVALLEEKVNGCSAAPSSAAGM